MSRVIVATAPVRGTFWSGLDNACVTHWRIDGTPVTTFSVCTRMILEGSSWLPGNPSSLPFDLPRRAPTIDEGMPIKNNADVIVRGAARFTGRTITLRTGNAVIPNVLAPGVQWPARSPLRDGISVSLAEDLSTFQLAPMPLQIPHLGPGSAIQWDVDGVTGPSGAVDFSIAVEVDLDDDTSISLDMIGDSLTIDLERNEANLVWRGMFVDRAWGRTTERFVVGVVPDDTTKSLRDELLDAGLARAHFSYAANGDDVHLQTIPPALTAEDLTMARLSAWDRGPGSPALDAEEFAIIAAELDAGPRKDVLERHGFDEISWGAEEWAHAERTANENIEIPDDQTEDSNAAERHVPPALPVGQTMSIVEYARLSAHLEVRDPGRVLEETKLSVRALVGLEMTMTEAMEQDPALAEEFERAWPTFREEVARAHAADLARTGIAADEDEGEKDA